MKFIGTNNCILRVEKDEWEDIKNKLISKRYMMLREDANLHKTLWSPDGQKCIGSYVTEFNPENGRRDSYYALDSCVISDLFPPGLYSIVSGEFTGVRIRLYFINSSHNADCRFAEDFGNHRAGEIIVKSIFDIKSVEHGNKNGT